MRWPSGLALLAAALAIVGAPSAGSHGASAAEPPGLVHRLYLPAAMAPPISGPVMFAPERGLFDAPFDLVLRTDAHGAAIRYTTDGSAPGPDHGLLYEGPIRIDAATAVRALAVPIRGLPSAVATHTYLFPDQVPAQTDDAMQARGLPEHWGLFPDDWNLAGEPVPADYGLDAGLAASYAGEIAAGLRALPSLSIVAPMEDLFGPDGIYSHPLQQGLERPVSAELIMPDGGAGFQVDCGARIAGGWSRKADVGRKFSFSLRFRADYGAPRLRFPLFEGSPVDSFDVLRLRASQADAFYHHADKGQYLHDQWGRDTQRDMGWLSPRGRYVHLYVDGLYWGLYNVAEEPTASFAADHLGGDEDDWDVLKDGDLVDGHWQTAVEDGETGAFDEMTGLVAERPAPDPTDPGDRARFARMSQLLDLAQHVDYTLVQIYGANSDWPHKNWRMARDRVIGGGFQTFVWDYEHVSGLHDDPARGFCLESQYDRARNECGNMAHTDGVLGLHAWLMHFPAYRQLFSDRAVAHLGAGGALGPAAATERYRALADSIEPAMAAESARWGTKSPMPRTAIEQRRIWRDYVPRRGEVPQTPWMWSEERDRLLRDYFPLRAGEVMARLCRAGIVTPVAPVAVRAERGAPGLGSKSVVVVEAAPGGCPGAERAGTIYVTTDGSDPREEATGAVSRGAFAYGGPFQMGAFARVRARMMVVTQTGALWGAPGEAVIGIPHVAFDEIHYHPLGGSDEEFVEIVGLDAAAIDLSGATLGGAVAFTFPRGTTLWPGSRVVVAANAEAFKARYGDVSIAGTFAGKLDNAGEIVVLRGAGGAEWLSVTYDDQGPWPLAPDEWGHSLVMRRPDADPSDPESWRASADPGGSPGRPDPRPRYGSGHVVVNELLAAPGPNQEDAIELLNPSAEVIDLSGWSLSDDVDRPGRFLMPPSTILGPGETMVLYARDFGAGVGGGFRLSSAGEELFLASYGSEGEQTGYLYGVSFGPAEPGTSFGRAETGGGIVFTALERPTFGVDAPGSVDEFRSGDGAPNAGPRTGPLIVSEVMDRSPEGRFPFVELRNRTGAPLSLGDAWSLAGSAEYAFPPGAVVPAYGYALVVPVSPDEFRAHVPVPQGVPVFGPFRGRLGPDGVVELGRPWPGDAGPDSPRLVEDRVAYGGGPPWPLRDVESLERRDPPGFGSDPWRWVALAAGGTPGRPNTAARPIWLPAVLRAY